MNQFIVCDEVPLRIKRVALTGFVARDAGNKLSGIQFTLGRAKHGSLANSRGIKETLWCDSVATKVLHNLQNCASTRRTQNSLVLNS